MSKRFYSIILKAQNRHLFVLDIIILSIIPLLSLILRFETVHIMASLFKPLLIYTLVSLILKITVFQLCKFYNRYWAYASVDEVAILFIATTLSWLVCMIAFFGILKPFNILTSGFPQSIPFIDGLLTMLMIGGVRVMFRLVYVFNEQIGAGVKNKNVLIVGAGIAGSMIVKELRTNPQLGMKPIAFVDDDPIKQNVNIHGIRVMGTLEQIPDIVKENRIDEIIIAMPTASGKTINNVVQICQTLKVKSKTIPGVFEIISGSAVAQLREVQINDLLRRGIIEINEVNLWKLIQGMRVMVTGAGGSIGSELCRQIINFHPKELIMLGHGENSIFQIANEIKTRHGVVGQAITFKTVIADIRDRDRMIQVMEESQPQIIFHAAAHKHVGLMEKNCLDAVTNNVLGTQILVELAARYGVEKFVMISSDKAVNPTSVMGVTKRVAELIVHNAAVNHRKAFVVVRFGNVLGSRGSIVPILEKQIRAGGPVTITHPEVTRFFMTIPEAVQLVLQAGALGECGETFVLDMGQPIKIVDLARDLIRLSGLHEGTDIDIVFTGLQKGEKMHEELFYTTENHTRSSHEKIFVCGNGDSLQKVAQDYRSSRNTISEESSSLIRDINLLVNVARAGKTDLVYQYLNKIVPQYRDDECLRVNLEDFKDLNVQERIRKTAEVAA
jgi:FlaA1/EpsC-like NDP-sugar epimerase